MSLPEVLVNLARAGTPRFSEAVLATLDQRPRGLSGNVPTALTTSHRAVHVGVVGHFDDVRRHRVAVDLQQDAVRPDPR